MAPLDRPFLAYGAYLRERYGRAVFRVAVDAGFSCPNRGPDRGRPGCAYCGVEGSRAGYLEGAESVEAQVRNALLFLGKRYKARRFLLYFQAYSNTHASVEALRTLYDRALALGDFKELIVSTRPDCVDAAASDLLASYRARGLDVWVELGLQSAHDDTLDFIRRGHSTSDFDDAFRLLRARGIKVAVHLVFGLPGEGWKEAEETVAHVAALRPDGVKLHNLHILRNAPLFQDYLAGELPSFSMNRHLEYVVRALRMLPPQTVIMRLNCDSDARWRVAPRPLVEKSEFRKRVERAMIERGVRQGDLWSADAGLPSS